MDLIYFLKVLYKRKWLILIISVLAVVATYFVTSDSSEVYKSRAQLKTGIVDNPDTEGKYVSNQTIQNKFQNLEQLVLSRNVVDLLSFKLALHDLNSPDSYRNSEILRNHFSSDELNNAIVDFKIKSDTLGAMSLTKDGDKTLHDILKMLEYDYAALRPLLSVSQEGETDYLNVEVRSENPELSAFIANAWSEEFIRYYKSLKRDRKFSSKEFYAKQVDEQLEKLEKKKNELNEFKLNNGIVDLSEQTTSILKQIKTFEMNKEEEKKKIPSYKNAVESLSKESGSASYEEIQRKNKKINNLRREINYFNDKYISGGSKDKKLLEQIEKLKAEMRDAIDESTTAYSSNGSSREDLLGKKVETEMELEIAQASVYSIDKEIQKLRNELAVMVSLEPKVSALHRDVAMAEEKYKEAINKLNLAETEVLKEEDQLRIFEPAMPALEPEPTKQLFFSLFSGMLSLSLCVVVIFVLEYLDLSIKTPRQFERFTGLSLLGYLNQINFINFNLDVNFIDINLESIFHNKNDNQQLESFKQSIRKIRFEVESMDAKRFLITSTKEGEGKTFLLMSLAYSLSLNNKRILLIDTNFKNNTLTNMLAAKPALEKHFNQDLVKEDIITRTQLKGIDIIGCYEGNYSPSEVFSQTNFHNLVNDLAQNYDFIFLEGAALNEYSDSKELVSSVEKIITVFSANTVIKDEDKVSIGYLRGLGDRFMGAVLNKVDTTNLS